LPAPPDHCLIFFAKGKELTAKESMPDDQRALSDRAIDSHVKNLRRKLERLLPGQETIRSIYGVGYRFDGL